MSNKKAEPAVFDMPKSEVFQLPEGIDTTLQVVPEQVLQAVVNVLNGCEAGKKREILNVLDNMIREKKIQSVSDYLLSLEK